eukprot:11553625-Alexandrium_andersonii.AAC.1
MGYLASLLEGQGSRESRSKQIGPGVCQRPHASHTGCSPTNERPSKPVEPQPISGSRCQRGATHTHGLSGPTVQVREAAADE